LASPTAMGKAICPVGPVIKIFSFLSAFTVLFLR
jgi:hypothetical protein